MPENKQNPTVFPSREDLDPYPLAQKRSGAGWKTEDRGQKSEVRRQKMRPVGPIGPIGLITLVQDRNQNQHSIAYKETLMIHYQRAVRSSPLWVLTLLIALPSGASAVRAEEANLDQILRKQAQAINQKIRDKYLKDSKTVNVGVLKFLVKRGGEKQFSDNTGTINLLLADRLEIALILANPDEKESIIEHASNVVAGSSKKKFANHRTAEGRKEFFKLEYPLAWGKPGDLVKADVFLTGEVVFSDNFRKFDVVIQSFDKDSKDLEEVGKFSAWADPRTLLEAGESFKIPEGAKGGPFKPADRDLLASAVEKSRNSAETMKFMWQSPVEVKIFYDDKEVEIVTEKDIAPGCPLLKRAKRFPSSLRNASEERVGVVLMVNGESTIFREQGDPAPMYKWILDKGEKIRIRGFQKSLEDPRATEFEVLSPEQSAKNEIKYGSNAGAFNVAVYYEQPDKGSGSGSGSPEIKEEDAQEASIARGMLRCAGTPKPGSLKALKGELQQSQQDSAAQPKGLVVGGADITSKVKKVPFKTDVNSGMRGTIYYYTPTRN